jgi:hypothetical protein
VTFSATVSGVNRTSLIGARADGDIQSLTAHATLTAADLNETIRDHTQLPVTITLDPRHHHQLTYAGSHIAVSVPLRIAPNNGDIDISAALPILGHVHLVLAPPMPVEPTALAATPNGMEVGAQVDQSAAISRFLC